jgi:hypothetical protein
VTRMLVAMVTPMMLPPVAYEKFWTSQTLQTIAEA